MTWFFSLLFALTADTRGPNAEEASMLISIIED
jgi:hypothetical protein